MMAQELYWCPFHNVLAGEMNYQARRRMIVETKPKHEEAIRLESFVKVKDVERLEKLIGEAEADASKPGFRRRCLCGAYWGVLARSGSPVLQKIRGLYEEEIPQEKRHWNWEKMELDFSKKEQDDG